MATNIHQLTTAIYQYIEKDIPIPEGTTLVFPNSATKAIQPPYWRIFPLANNAVVNKFDGGSINSLLVQVDIVVAKGTGHKELNDQITEFISAFPTGLTLYYEDPMNPLSAEKIKELRVKDGAQVSRTPDIAYFGDEGSDGFRASITLAFRVSIK